MNAPHHQTRLEAELGRAVVRIAELEEENERLRGLLLVEDTTPEEWKLTPMEERLVLAMFKAAPRILTNERALSVVWPDSFPDVGVLPVMVCKIRQKLKVTNATIRTVWGRGYILEPEACAGIRARRDV